MVAPLARLDEIWPIIAETGITPPGDAAAMQSGRFRWWLNWLCRGAADRLCGDGGGDGFLPIPA